MVLINNLVSIVHKVLKSTYPITTFKLHKEELSNVKFLLFDEEKTSFEFAFGNKQFGNYNIVDLADYGKLYVLDSNSAFSNVGFQIGHCIEFDSNVIGDWKNIIFDKKVKSDLEDMLLFIKKSGKQFSCEPYMLEMAANGSFINKEVVYKSLLAFSIFDNIDSITLEKKKLDQSHASSVEFALADDRWRALLDVESDLEANPVKSHDFIYCLLLKAFYIKYASKKSTDNKILELIYSINNELFSYWENEMMLCYLFIKEDSSVEKFFGGAKPNAKNIIRKLKGMAWDLFHLRNLEISMTERNTNQSMVFLHSFGSADQGIVRMIKLNPITRMAFFDGKSIVIHEKNILNTCTHLGIKEILDQNEAKRREKCLNIDYRELSKQLEVEVLGVMKTNAI